MDDKQTMDMEQHLLRDRFIDFERGILQDNVLLCDTKAGLLLAFTGAMVIFCIDLVAKLGETGSGASWAVAMTIRALLGLAGAGFLVSAHFSLTTVLPRMIRGRPDHLFWESPVYYLPADEFVAEMQNLDPKVEQDDKLRHVHLLAGICRGKFQHFQIAMRYARLSFLCLVAGEVLRIVI